LAVKVTACPGAEGLTLENRYVEVEVSCTVWVSAEEVLPAKTVSPL